MSTTINTNVTALVAQNALKVNGRAMSTVMEQLSTGKRINSAKDDAAGLAIAEGMSAQIRSLNMAVRNANDGISLAQTAEGAMIEITNMIQRMRELAVQASNGTVSTDQRDYLQSEFSALADQITATTATTSWNGMKLLNGSHSAISIQVSSMGSGSGITVDVTLTDVSGLDVLSGDISGSTGSDARAVIADADTSLDVLSEARAGLGAVVNRLTSAADNLTNISQNLSASRSRIVDTDYAQATTELARTMIIQQAGTAIMAQANQMPMSVLALLR
ncbi:MAG: Flagellin [Pseudomonadota bacterium]|jgi:flagellin